MGADRDLPTTMLVLRKPADRAGLDVDGDAAVPTPGPTDVIVEVTYAGVCGTDRHIWDHDEWAAARVAAGTVVGHELVGRVVSVGSAVERIQPGQRVSAEGHIGCGTCRTCRTGSMHICPTVDIIGVDRDGCFGEYVRLPAHNVWPIHDTVPDHHAVLMDPLGNAVHTVDTGEVSGRTVLVTGAGVIGLLAVAVARLQGAERIIVSDVDPDRLAIAREFGADVTIDARDPDRLVDIRRATFGGADVLLEVSGARSALADGLAGLRNGGRAALLGLPSLPVEIDLAEQVIFKGLSLHGVNGRQMFRTWYQADTIIRSGRVDVDRLITGRFPISEPARAFAALDEPGTLKVLLDVAGSSHHDRDLAGRGAR
jgi:threonine 3-dehydrogenase